MQLVQIIVNVAGWAILALAEVFCLACGLYIAADWLEDHVRTSFRIIKRATVWSLAAQLTWILVDRSAVLPNLVGLASHANSWFLLKGHPNHLATHWLLGFAAIVLLIAHQTTWIYWWFSHYGASWTVATVLASLVWPVPTLLLLSSANSDEALPVSIGPLPGLRAQHSYSSPLQSPTAVKRPGPVHLTHLTHHRPQRSLLPESDASKRRAQDQQQHLNGSRSNSQDGVMGMLQHSAAGLNPWGAAGGAQQPAQQGRKQHRSRVLQGFSWLQGLAKQHELLPVTDVDAEAAVSPGQALLSKLYKD